MGTGVKVGMVVGVGNGRVATTVGLGGAVSKIIVGSGKFVVVSCGRESSELAIKIATPMAIIVTMPPNPSHNQGIGSC